VAVTRALALALARLRALVVALASPRVLALARPAVLAPVAAASVKLLVPPELIILAAVELPEAADLSATCSHFGR